MESNIFHPLPFEISEGDDPAGYASESLVTALGGQLDLSTFFVFLCATLWPIAVDIFLRLAKIASEVAESVRLMEALIPLQRFLAEVLVLFREALTSCC